MSNLWPNFEENQIRTPKSILKEQAKFLSEATKNLVQVEVQTSGNNKQAITHYFRIVAPSIKNYRFNLFTVTHNQVIYPVTVMHNSQRTIISEESEFITKLGEIFKDEKTIAIIQSLMAQAKEESVEE